MTAEETTFLSFSGHNDNVYIETYYNASYSFLCRGCQIMTFTGLAEAFETRNIPYDILISPIDRSVVLGQGDTCSAISKKLGSACDALISRKISISQLKRT
jgi:hypothetical protein